MGRRTKKGVGVVGVAGGRRFVVDGAEDSWGSKLGKQEGPDTAAYYPGAGGKGGGVV